MASKRSEQTSFNKVLLFLIRNNKIHLQIHSRLPHLLAKQDIMSTLCHYTPLSPIIFSTLEHISVNLIEPLSESDGFDTILCIMVHFSKIVLAFFTTITLISPGLASIYKKKVFYFFVVSCKIVSDHSPQFASEYICNIC